MHELYQAAQACFDELVEIRRTVHRWPELGRTEVRTSQLIFDKLTELGVADIQRPVPTAVVGYIRGTKGAGKTLAIRADIDTLAVTEETGLPFASEHTGFMHCCGHDMHVAMLLGVAKLLMQRRDTFAGTVKLIFQHSEDTLPGGAKELVELGVMDDVDAIFGMHVMPDETAGRVMIHPGPLTTSVDLFDVTVVGKGGHGSTPHLTRDPILAACQMVVALQQIPSRRIDPLETVIAPVCSFHSGDAPNVIPNEAKFGGVARAYEDSVRKQLTEEYFAIGKGIEAMTGCQVNIHHYEGYPSVYNDHALTALVRRAAVSVLGEELVEDRKDPFAFSEDFSYFTKMTGKPGCYFMVAAGYTGDQVYPLHNCKCSMREEAMLSGVSVMTGAALTYLAE